MSGGVRVLALETPWQHEWRLFWRQLGAEYDREATFDTHYAWAEQGIVELEANLEHALLAAFEPMMQALVGIGW